MRLPSLFLGMSGVSNLGSSSATVTNSQSPDFSGLADPEQIVTLYELGVGPDGGALGQTVAALDGTWNIGLASILADGVHKFVVAESGGQSETPSYSDHLSITVDTIAPDAPVLDTGLFNFGRATDASYTRLVRPVLRGFSEALSTVTLYEEPIGSGGLAAALGLVPSIGTEAVGVDGSWAFAPASDLAEGPHEWVAIATDIAGNQSFEAPVLSFVVDTVAPPAPPAPTLAIRSDGGNNQASTASPTPTLVGSAEPGSTVELFDEFTQAHLMFGTATAASDGLWSYTFTTPLADGVHKLSLEARDASGNLSPTSEQLQLHVNAFDPPLMVTLGTKFEKGLVQGPVLTGTAQPGTIITLEEGSLRIGSVVTSPTGDWTYDASPLATGQHIITALVTQPNGTVLQSDAARFDVQGPRFTFADNGKFGTLVGGDYSGPVSYLDAQLVSTSDENSVFGASIANVFLHSGRGDDALNASSGSNILDGGAGSNFMTGATGLDGGFDTFFIDGRNIAVTWDTIVNFHPGDVVDVFGYSPTAGSFKWSGDMGATGYLGATVQIDLGDGQGVSTLATLANLSSSTINVGATVGNIGGLTYLELRLA